MSKTKVVMQVAIAGHADPDNGHDKDFSYAPGQEVELDSGLAKAWHEVGHCKIIGKGAPAPKPAQPETPSAPATETQPPAAEPEKPAEASAQPPAKPKGAKSAKAGKPAKSKAAKAKAPEGSDAGAAQ
jgi:hypothetical protein